MPWPNSPLPSSQPVERHGFSPVIKFERIARFLTYIGMLLPAIVAQRRMGIRDDANATGGRNGHHDGRSASRYGPACIGRPNYRQVGHVFRDLIRADSGLPDPRARLTAPQAPPGKPSLPCCVVRGGARLTPNPEGGVMRWMVIATLVAGGPGISTPVMPAHAAGCLKGAVIGGVAGHFAGHHGVLGAGAGCAIGHHEASKEARAQQQQQQQQQAGSDIGHGSEAH